MAYMLKLEYDEKKVDAGFIDRSKALRIGVKNTLSIQAFLTRKNAIKEVNQNFILRNKFTTSQIKVDKVSDNRLAIRNMEAHVGASDRAEFMERQELGGIHRPKHGKNLAIPQLPARSGSLRRLVSKSNYLKAIRNKTVRGGFKNARTWRSRLVASAFVSFNKDKFLYYNKNIYKISSFTKSRNQVHFKKIHLYHTGKQSTRTHADPWLEPSTKRPSSQGQQIFNSQMDKLLKAKEII
jgi:hypothetical protein